MYTRMAFKIVNLVIIILFMCNVECSDIQVTVSSLNCNGIKSNFAYIKDLVKRHHINFVCEYWLHSEYSYEGV